MGIFDTILHKLGFGDDEQQQAAGEVNVQNQVESALSTPEVDAPAEAPAEAPAASEAPAPVAQVDVVAKLEVLAANAGEDLDWQRSIVDLMKLLGIDSSYAHRKQLAEEMGIAGYEGTAEQNIALHKTVLQKLAENGGNIPAELLA